MSGAGTVLVALALFALWTLATYVLEGRVRTLQRPEERRRRLVYAVVANVLIGTVVAGLAIRHFLRAEPALDPGVFGIAPAARIALTVTAATLLGGIFLARQRPAVRNSVVLLNGFSQTLVVSTIVFHNFMALEGVLGALRESGRLQAFTRVRASLVAMAAAAVLVLVTVDVAFIRTAMIS